MKADQCVILSEIQHSQSLNESPFKAWLVVNNDGVVKDGYCQCLCGHSGKCSHIVGLLMFLQRHHSQRTTVTETSCYWIGNKRQCIPTEIKEVSYESVNLNKEGGGSKHNVKARQEFSSKLTSEKPSEEKKKALLSKLRLVAPDASVLQHSTTVNVHTQVEPKYAGNSLKNFIDVRSKFIQQNSFRNTLLILSNIRYLQDTKI